MKIPEVMTFIPPSKNGYKMIAEQVVGYVCDDGDINPLDLKCILKGLKEIIDLIEKNENYVNSLNKELNKYPDKQFNFNRYGITKMSKTTYDYSNDPVWNGFKNSLVSRETLLKNIKEPMADPSTGEMVYPAIVSKTDYIQIKPLE